MPDYKSMYFHLAARVADAVELPVRAQREAEERYIQSEAVELEARGEAESGQD